MITTFLLAPFLFAAPPQGPSIAVTAPNQSVARAVQVLPTGGVLRPLPALPKLRFGTLLEAKDGVLEPFGPPNHGTEPYLTPDHLVELVRLGIGVAPTDTSWTLEVHRDRLLASGAPDLVELARKRLDVLLEQATRPIRLDLEVWALGDRATPVATVLTQEQVAEATRGLTRLWQATGSARPGTSTTLGATRRVRYVQGLTSMVAQKSQVTVPVMAELEVGPRVCVEAHLLANRNEMVLFVQLQLGELATDIAMRSTGSNERPTLDTPVLRSCSGTFSGRVQDGGALAVTIRGDGDNQRLVLVRATAGLASRDLEKLGIVPTSALTSFALTQSLDFVHGFPELENAAAGVETPFGGYLQSEVLESVISAAFEGNTMPADAYQDDHFLALPPDGEAVKKAAATVRVLEDLMLRNGSLDLVLGHVPDQEGARGRASGTLPRGLQMPILLSRAHAWIVGTESRAVVGYQAELAQESAVLDPTTTTVFRGFTLNFETTERAGAPTGIAAVLAVTNHPEPLVRALGGKNGGDLQRTDIERAVFTIQHSGAMPYECGDGPRADREGKPGLCRPTLTVTELAKPSGR